VISQKQNLFNIANQGVFMSFASRLMLKINLPERRRLKNLIATFDDFVNHIYFGEDIPSIESIKSLENGVVELRVCDGKDSYSSNGLLITENGYFLTALHGLKHELCNAYITMPNGTEYPLTKLCAVGKNYDIALAKAKIPGECKAMKYRFYNTNNLSKIPVKIITRKEEKLREYYGSTIGLLPRDFSSLFQEHFDIFTNECIPGDSGGVVISPEGGLMGFISNGNNGVYYASAIKIIKALELVDFYKRELQRKLG